MEPTRSIKCRFCQYVPTKNPAKAYTLDPEELTDRLHKHYASQHPDHYDQVIIDAAHTAYETDMILEELHET